MGRERGEIKVRVLIKGRYSMNAKDDWRAGADYQTQGIFPVRKKSLRMRCCAAFRTTLGTRGAGSRQLCMHALKRPRIDSGDMDQQPTDYRRWSRRDLIARIRELEGGMDAGAPALPPPATRSEQAPTPKVDAAEGPAERKKKGKRQFDFDSYPTVRVAFKFAYLGWPYNGLAFQTTESALESVEERLAATLLRLGLIRSWDDCEFSRCGRTDRGVSSMGQVCALRVRAARPNADGSEAPEVPYLSMLNRALPKDIRVLAYALPLPEGFDARRSCTGRHYKYFFTRVQPSVRVDISRMRDALARLVGTHDFRNFCKLDGSKQITDYHRTIRSASIEPVGLDGMALSDTSAPEDQHVLWCVNLHGSGFLWHQVRNVMRVLLLVGQGLEEPGVVDALMDMDTNPCKPEYEMADELPLVLWDTDFEGIEWRGPRERAHAESHARNLWNETYELWHSHMMRFVMTSLLEGRARKIAYDTCVDDAEATQEALLPRRLDRVMTATGSGAPLPQTIYTPLLQRKRSEPVHVLNARYLERKQYA